MEKKLCFLVEDCEVEVPEHFEIFSVVVDNYIKTYLHDSDGLPKKGESVIPLSNFKKDHLQLILEFFYALKEHPSSQKNAIGIEQNVFSATNKGAENLPRSFSQVELEDAAQTDLDTTQGELEEENIDGAVVEEDVEKSAFNEKSDNEKSLNDAKRQTQPPNLSHLSSDIKVAKLPDWAQDFFEKVPKERLFQASMLANYLLAHPFIEHAAFFIANKLKSFGSISEMREYLNAKKDFKENEFDLLANDPTWRERLLEEGLISEKK